MSQPRLLSQWGCLFMLPWWRPRLPLDCSPLLLLLLVEPPQLLRLLSVLPVLLRQPLLPGTCSHLPLQLRPAIPWNLQLLFLRWLPLRLCVRLLQRPLLGQWGHHWLPLLRARFFDSRSPQPSSLPHRLLPPEFRFMLSLLLMLLPLLLLLLLLECKLCRPVALLLSLLHESPQFHLLLLPPLGSSLLSLLLHLIKLLVSLETAVRLPQHRRPPSTLSLTTLALPR